jgi:hypothetical protein
MVYPRCNNVLQENFRFCRSFIRAAGLAGLACIATMNAGPPADPPLVPMGVCEVLRDLGGMDAKNVAVVGRYSFRAGGRWLSEQVCDAPAAVPPELWLVEDTREAPRLPDHFEIDNLALHKKLVEMERHTTLGKFRFGTPDYDRWAVIYGRVEQRKGDAAKTAPANLLFRGSGVVVFVSE